MVVFLFLIHYFSFFNTFNIDILYSDTFNQCGESMPFNIDLYYRIYNLLQHIHDTFTCPLLGKLMYNKNPGVGKWKNLSSFRNGE